MTTDPAATLRWTVDDGVSYGEVTGASAVTWSFNWDLKTLGTIPFVYDGTYLVSAQAYDTSGVPGEARAVSVSINRRVPYAPTSLVGGHNTQFGGAGGVVDLDWTGNLERDVVGYRIWRVNLLGLTRTQICDDGGLTYTVKTSCTDTNPELLTLPVGTPHYEIAAVDYTDLKNGTGLRNSPNAVDKATVTLASTSTRPGSPVLAVPTIVDGSPKLTWSTPTVGLAAADSLLPHLPRRRHLARRPLRRDREREHDLDRPIAGQHHLAQVLGHCRGHLQQRVEPLERVQSP